MNHPDFALITVEHYHDYLRSLAAEPPVPEHEMIWNHPVRRRLGEALVEVGFRLGGYAVRTEPRYRVSVQET